MKFILRSAFVIALFIASTSMFLQKTTHIVFFGDSITEAGVAPNGFITKIGEELMQKGIAGQYKLTGAGIGGNKVYDLYLRMDEDVLAKNPNVVVIWVGVNDVWHKASFGTGTDPDKFEKFYRAIINKLQEKKIRVILCTPATIGEKNDYTNQQDGDLNAYSQIVRDLARNYHCSLVDFRSIFHRYEQQNNPENRRSGILTVDGVHLNDKGNQLAADEMLKAVLEQ
ncbi:MAG: SGNH/GDSL hydrolase family protein [Bacteroidetes bacterium]|nr:SGNH/GDSL hydrolase family protein [Bacteroidota bacterium]MBS1974210.1 SGNH/GDSL hydrolase family protein [Bacteroidota bacterium]